MHFPAISQRIRIGQPVTVCLFGSSTMEGIGASSPEHAFAAVFEKSLRPFMPSGLKVINRGIGGNGAREMHDRLQEALDDHADLVIWQGGTNDAWQEIPVERFVEQTRQDLLTLHRNGSDLAMIGPQWSKMMEECPHFPPFLEAVPHLARELDIPYFDRHKAMQSWCVQYGMGRDDLSPDGLHMGDFGYRLLGESVANWIGKYVAAEQKTLQDA